jgi:hypothetical protein
VLGIFCYVLDSSMFLCVYNFYSHDRGCCTVVSILQAHTRFHVWVQFVLVVLAEFEVDTHRAKTMELLSLRYHGSVEEYRRKLEQLVYNIRQYDRSLSNTMLTT